MTVVSTGLAHPEKAACLASCAEQEGVSFEHVYVEASEQVPPKSSLENLHDVVMTLPPDRVVACLDGDDTFAGPGSLATVAAIYERRSETWLTYGQFASNWRGGSVSMCSPYPTSDYRADPVWRASHLKTFRAALFQRVRLESLMWKGDFTRLAVDLAFMIPMLEMAGPGRVVFNPHVVYRYNMANAARLFADERAAEQLDVERFIRSQPPYARLHVL